MELTLPHGSLDERMRADVGRFYDEILGWKPLDVEIVGQKALLLRVDEEVSQFVLVAESPRPMASPGHDHLGVLLDTRAQVDATLEKCKRYRATDDRVEIREYDDLVIGDLTVHAFYVKYLLPIYFDVQSMEWKPGSEPERRWRYA
jgi:hypothetical protein